MPTHNRDILAGIILIRWSPRCDYLGHRIAVIVLDVSPEDAECSPKSIPHGDELFKLRVITIGRWTLPEPIVPYPYVEWVVVPDSPRDCLFSTVHG